jgi:hypothetical protein
MRGNWHCLSCFHARVCVVLCVYLSVRVCIPISVHPSRPGRPLRRGVRRPLPKVATAAAPVKVLRVHVGAVREQRRRHRRVPLLSGVMERRVPAVESARPQCPSLTHPPTHPPTQASKHTHAHTHTPRTACVPMEGGDVGAHTRMHLLYGGCCKAQGNAPGAYPDGLLSLTAAPAASRLCTHGITARNDVACERGRALTAVRSPVFAAASSASPATRSAIARPTTAGHRVTPKSWTAPCGHRRQPQKDGDDRATFALAQSLLAPDAPTKMIVSSAIEACLPLLNTPMDPKASSK